MDLNDLISGGSEYLRNNRPQHPDLDRISEIVLAMKADISENAGDPAKQQELWEARVRKHADFDSVTWQALQAAAQIMSIETGADLMAVRSNRTLNAAFIGHIQAFMDGWMMAHEFRDRGGKR